MDEDMESKFPNKFKKMKKKGVPNFHKKTTVLIINL